MSSAATERRISTRKLRWQRSYNRRLLSVVLVVLGGLGVWRSIDPPRQVTRIEPIAGIPDLPAEALARDFTTAYETFDARHPEQRQQAMAPFLGPDATDQLGSTLPSTGARHVIADPEIVQVFTENDVHRYVLRVVTDTDGVTYLSVSVGRHPDGSLAIVGDPAIVGPPSLGAPMDMTPGPSVQDTVLQDVVTRAMRNYLTGNDTNLAADLAATANVAMPAQPLTLQRLTALTWKPTGSAVLATVAVTDRDGMQMTLTYVLGVERLDRWVITAIHTNPIGH